MGGKLFTWFIVSVIIASITTVACKKDEETYNGQSISMHAKLDGHDWSTSSVYANYSSGILSIVGSNPLLGTITISVNEFSEGTYELGTDIHKFATYTNKDQITYFSNPYGSGEVSISTIDTDNKFVSGTFYFNAKAIAGNQIIATEGVFYSYYD